MENEVENRRFAGRLQKVRGTIFLENPNEELTETENRAKARQNQSRVETKQNSLEPSRRQGVEKYRATDGTGR